MSSNRHAHELILMIRAHIAKGGSVLNEQKGQN